MKAFVSMDNSRVSSKIITKWWIRVAFNRKLMDEMVNSYACAKWISACDSMWRDFANNIRVRKQISEWFEESKDIIKKANDEFIDAFLSFSSSVRDTFWGEEAGEEIWLTPRQLALLRTVYGIDTTKLSKEQWIWLEKTIFAITNFWKMVNNVKLKPLDYFSAEKKAIREEISRKREQEKQDAKKLAKLSDNELKKIEEELKSKKYAIPTRYETGMQAALEATLVSVFTQKQEDKELFMIYSNLSITKYFVEIWAYIHNILEKYIWNKDSKWLIKYLWKVCESQCSNKWISNCYAK